MSELIFYHNPKCSKSREALSLLQERGLAVTVVEYLKNPLKENELLQLLKKLGTSAPSLVRAKDDEYLAAPFDLQSSEAIAKALAMNPKLMERPVLVKGAQAVIGRPVEQIERIIS